MRKVISIGLIFVLLAPSLYRLGVVTYFHLNRGYVAQVLCINKAQPMTMCYGNCFLKRNLKLDHKSEKSTTPGNKNKIEIPSFIMLEDDFTFHYTSMLKAALHLECSDVMLRGFPTTIFHPPAVV